MDPGIGAGGDPRANLSGILAMLLSCIFFVVGDCMIRLVGASLPLGEMMLVRGALSVPLVTLGGSLVLIAYTLALVIVRPAVDPALATALGATLVLLLALVNIAAHLGRAVIAPSVIAAQVRQWVVIVAVGSVVAAVLAVAATALAPVLQGATLPVVVAVAGLGAVLTVAGLIALLRAPAAPSGPQP